MNHVIVKPRSLRFWLSSGLTALVALSALAMMLVVLTVLMPRLNRDALNQNKALSATAAKQIDHFLADFSSEIRRVGDDITARTRTAEQRRLVLDTVSHANKGIESIYLLDDNNRVVDVGLPKQNRALRNNQIGIDFSGRTFLKATREREHEVWSDTYLSARGNIVVAFAIPLRFPTNAKRHTLTNGVLVGELNLYEVSRFAGLLSIPHNTLTVIVDQRGNVVGHPDAERALHQENLAHLSLLTQDPPTSGATRFKLDATDYLGSVTLIPATGWTALVGQPTEKAFAAVKTTLLSLAACVILALSIAMIAALVASRRIMTQVDVFAGKVAAIANGSYHGKIPKSGIEELNVFSQHLQGMASAVLEREAKLRESESSFRTLVERVPQGIALIARNGRILLTNAAFHDIFGLCPTDAPDITSWWKLTCPDSEHRQDAIRQWRNLIAGTEPGQGNQASFTLYRSDGSPRDIDLAAQRLPDARLLLTASDTTERKRNEARLQRAAKVFSHAREGIVITDAKGIVVEINDTFRHMTNYDASEIIGKNLRILRLSHQANESYRSMWNALVRNGNWQGEIWLRSKNGPPFATLTNITAVFDTVGELQNYVVLFTDISDIKAYQRQLEHIAHYDPLTGLPNRMLLADRLNQAIRRSQRRGLSLAVLYLDLDSFKAINDQLSHDAGDKLLVAIAHRLKETLRESDTISRIGGDEFVAVLPDLEHETDCQPIIERLLCAAAAPLTIDGKLLRISASIGITFYPRDNVDADLLMRHADQAMYQAKQIGKNRFSVFDATLDAETTARHQHREQIHNALSLGQFVLHYQPKVNLRDGKVVGVEALVRWQHPELGLLPPHDFLPSIHDHPLGMELGEWVLNQALCQIGEWRRSGLLIPVSVNISAQQLLHGNFNDMLSALLNRHPDIPHDQLELEILEKSTHQDARQVSEIMYQCLASGVEFSIDDFGSGNSSLSELKQLPARTLKIDQRLVSGMLDNADDLSIVSSIIGLATTFRRNVVAEGVETERHGARLLELGCSLAQGFCISAPMPATDLPAWIKHWNSAPLWTSSPQTVPKKTTRARRATTA